MSGSKIPLIPNEKIYFQSQHQHRNPDRRRRPTDQPHNLTPQKFSWFLRHSTAVAEHMDPEAFVSFEVLERISGASKSRMMQIIADDQKGRYEVRGDEEVRAVNGHSVHFLDNYEVISSCPEYLYHATNDKALPLIMAGALKRMGRHYIHLYDKPPQKTSVRYRILRIRPPESHTFYRTKNGYVLCHEDIPAECIEVWN